MAEGDGRGGERDIMGRRRSEGGERLTRIKRREEGEVEKNFLRDQCKKCGEKIYIIVKEKGIQVEMGHRGCCTLRKVEQQLGERRSGKKPHLGDDWKGALGREGVVKVTAEELTKQKRRTAERKAMGKKVVQTRREAIARGDRPGERRERNLREAMERRAEKEMKKM